MEFSIKEKLEEKEKIQITDLFLQKINISSSQHPYWTESLGKNSRVIFFLGKENNIIHFYCKCIESRFQKLSFLKTVSCNMPYFADNQSAIEGILFVQNYYKQKKFAELSLQLNTIEGNNLEFIEQTIRKSISLFYRYNKFNKSTLVIDLKKSIDEIKDKFSTVLKKNLRMAMNKGVYCKEINTSEKFTAFITMYHKMCLSKKIHLNDAQTLQRLYSFITKNNTGLIVGAYNSDDILIGGTIVVFHGNKAEYIIGATDPDYKKLPSSHISIFESIAKSKERGYDWFDMGGYAFYASKNDGYISINDFKSNFTRNLVFYPKRMYFPLHTIYHYMYSKLYKYII